MRNDMLNVGNFALVNKSLLVIATSVTYMYLCTCNSLLIKNISCLFFKQKNIPQI